MLQRLVPSAIVRSARRALRKATRFCRAYYPHEPGSESYLIPREPEPAERHGSSPWEVKSNGPLPDRRAHALRWLIGGRVRETLALLDASGDPRDHRVAAVIRLLGTRPPLRGSGGLRGAISSAH